MTRFLSHSVIGPTQLLPWSIESLFLIALPPARDDVTTLFSISPILGSVSPTRRPRPNFLYILLGHRVPLVQLQVELWNVLHRTQGRELRIPDLGTTRIDIADCRHKKLFIEVSWSYSRHEVG